MIKTLKKIPSAPGTFVQTRSRSGDISVTLCGYWFVYGLYNASGDLVEVISEPARKSTNAKPELMRDGFIRFSIESLPENLFMY